MGARPCTDQTRFNNLDSLQEAGTCPHTAPRLAPNKELTLLAPARLMSLAWTRGSCPRSTALAASLALLQQPLLLSSHGVFANLFLSTPLCDIVESQEGGEGEGGGKKSQNVTRGKNFTCSKLPAFVPADALRPNIQPDPSFSVPFLPIHRSWDRDPSSGAVSEDNFSHDACANGWMERVHHLTNDCKEKTEKTQVRRLGCCSGAVQGLLRTRRNEWIRAEDTTNKLEHKDHLRDETVEVLIYQFEGVACSVQVVHVF